MSCANLKPESSSYKQANGLILYCMYLRSGLVIHKVEEEISNSLLTNSFFFFIRYRFNMNDPSRTQNPQAAR